VALLREMTCNLRHPMGLRHPVAELFPDPRPAFEGATVTRLAANVRRHIFVTKRHIQWV